MQTKETITREFHFDDPKENDKHMEIMKKEGYEIIKCGSEDDWYFYCRKEIKSERVNKYGWYTSNGISKGISKR